MAGTKTRRKKNATHKGARRKTAARRRTRSALARFEQDLPPNLRDFSRRVRAGLSRLERSAGKAQARTRRQAAHVLRESSHALGRFEAVGQRGWRTLTTPARRQALRLLRRLDALAPSMRRTARAH